MGINLCGIRSHVYLLTLLSIILTLSLKAQNSVTENVRIIVDSIEAPTEADSLLKASLEKITGKDQNLSDRNLVSGKHIILTKYFILPEEEKQLKDSESKDAFYISINGDEIILAAWNDLALRYAVSTLLEEYFGVMFLNVSEIYYPDSLIWPKKVISKLYMPAFPFRLPHFQGRYDEDFTKWHKNSTFDDWGMFVHTFNKLVSPEIYYNDFPEYFALVSERRLADGQLCLSNDSLIGLLIHNLGKEIAKNPEKKYWSVSQNDCYNYCECENCQNLYDKYGSISGVYIEMVNKIASVYPDYQISTLAYQFTRSAPKNIKPLPNVNIMFCSIECNRSMPLDEDPRSIAFVNDMKDWDKISDNIFMWDYVVQFQNYVTPFPNINVLQPNIQFFKENGATMMFQQGSGKSWSDLSELKQYVISKLLWDPSLNMDSLVNRFLTGYYGRAAPYIREYYDITSVAIQEVCKDEDLNIYGYPVSYYKSHLRPELLLQYQNLMKLAIESVKDDSVFLKRVIRCGLPVEFAIFEIALNFPDDNFYWIESREGRSFVNADMIKRLDRFVKMCDLTGIVNINEKNLTPEAYSEYTKRKLNMMAKDNLAKDASVISTTSFSPKYNVGGEAALTDKRIGGLGFRYNWLGYEGKNMELIIDLKHDTIVKSVSMNFLKDYDSWIFLPLEVEVYGSLDGKTYNLIDSVITPEQNRSFLILSVPYNLNLKHSNLRYLKVKAKNRGTCPEWHRGFGRPSWIFIDELVVE